MSRTPVRYGEHDVGKLEARDCNRESGVIVTEESL